MSGARIRHQHRVLGGDVRGIAHRDQARRVLGLGHVCHVEEPLEIPPRISSHRWKPGMVAVGVHGLLIVGHARVLGGGVDLVEADVAIGECPLGEVDDRRMDAQPVERSLSRERKFPCQMCCAGLNPGPSSGQTNSSSATGGRPSLCSVTPSGSAWYSSLVGNIGAGHRPRRLSRQPR